MVADSEIVKRKLRELRVVDLKNELERRSLDKNGVKATLIDRLSKALQDEGLDAEEFVFEIVEKKAVVKRTSINKPDQDACDLDGTSDGVDASLQSPTLDVDRKIKPDPEEMKDVKPKSVTNDTPDMNTSTQDEDKCVLKPEDPSLNQENNDGAEDFINLNVDEEEEFGEEDHHSKDKDETSLRIGSSQQQFEDDRPAKSPNGSAYGHSTSSGGGINDATPNSGKPSSARDDVGRDAGEEQNRDATENNKGAPASDSVATSSSSSGEKVKSGSTGSKDGFKSAARDDRDKKKGSSASSSPSAPSAERRSLWVSGLSASTRATDLKHLFSKYGKVVGVKVVTNAKTPGARCYGFVTMSTAEEASECIERFDRSELHGRMISVERAKGEGSRKGDAKSPPESKTDGAASGSEKGETTKEGGESEEAARTEAPSVDLSTATGDALSISSAGNAKDNREERSASAGAKDGPEERGGSSQRERDRNQRDRNWFDNERKNRPRRAPSPIRHRQVLTHKQIKEEHERQRLREREREEHRAERRRQEELARLREHERRQHERRQRDETFRLEKERLRLIKEREQLERERLRFERERLEREKADLQREREKAEAEELRKRSFTRVEEVRRAPKRPGERDDYYAERKRVTVDPSIRYDAPSRYDDAAKASRSGHYAGATSGPLNSDYRATKSTGDSGYDSRMRFDRSAPASVPATSTVTVTRRVVQEVPARRPHSPPPPQRDRSDDRRVVDRGRDDRYDRGNRGRDSYGDRDQRRDRERPRDERSGNNGAGTDAMRNRIPDRDHRERYDSRSGKDGHRYNDRGSQSWQRGSSGVAASSSAAAPKTNYPGAGTSLMSNGSMPTGSAWNGNGAGQSDRWGSSSMSMGRSMNTSGGATFNNWTGAAPPLATAVFNPPIGGLGGIGGGVIGQSGSVSYSGDRYSSRH